MSPESTARSSLSAIPVWRLSQESARHEFESLESWLFSPEAMDLPLDRLEREQETRGREVFRLMLQAHIQARGLGDVGDAIEVVPVKGEENVLELSFRNKRSRHETTIFGEVEVQRLGYSRPGVPAIHPLDEDLSLPERTYSYEVQRRLVKAAVQGPFDEAVERLEESTGVKLPKRTAEEIVQDAAEDFATFYQERKVAPPEECGPIVVGAVDGKGVPMVKPKPAECPIQPKKEERPNKKRMATVATVYTMEPRIRTPEQVVESLFWPELKRQDEEKKSPRKKPENKRVWASLKESKEAVIDEVSQEMKRRDPEGKKKHVAVTDGERALQIRVKKQLGPSVLLIHELQH